MLQESPMILLANTGNLPMVSGEDFLEQNHSIEPEIHESWAKGSMA